MGIATLVAAVTVALVVLEGMGTTSAAIELVVFGAGIAGWALAGRLERSGASAERISSRTGSVRVEQTGSRVDAREIDAFQDVEVVQKSGGDEAR